MAKPQKSKVKKSKLKVKLAVVKLCLNAGFNNSIVTMTDMEGRVIAWASGGKMGFKGSRKATPFAAQKATEEILEKVAAVEASSIHIEIKGAGQARDSFLRAIQSKDIQIDSIRDRTTFPFGGVQKSKRRRV
jgi:small subunit ribosomal protein S11